MDIDANLILADLAGRLQGGLAALDELQAEARRTGRDWDLIRLGGKVEGLKVVQDWIRSYG